jgi:hypothetical protein
VRSSGAIVVSAAKDAANLDLPNIQSRGVVRARSRRTTLSRGVCSRRSSDKVCAAPAPLIASPSSTRCCLPTPPK